MKRLLLAASMLVPAAAVAQQSCNPAAPASFQCQAEAAARAGNDIGDLTQAEGPQQSTETLWMRLKTFLFMDHSILLSGARCDGTTDDTRAINSYLARFGGGEIRIPPGAKCLINSGNLVVPPNVRLVGSAGPVIYPRVAADTSISAIVLNPSSTIMLHKGAQLEHLMIQRPGLLRTPTAEQVIAAVAEWGAETSVAVTLPRVDGGGQRLRDLFIIGFNTAIYSGAGQFSMDHIAGDDYNGIAVATAGDNATISDARFEPYYALGLPATSGAWARPGIAFNFHDGDTLGGTALVGGFSFMYANGLVMSHIGITRVTDSGFEWQSSFGGSLTGTAGARLVGTCAACTISGTYFAGFDTDVSVEVGNYTQFSDILLNIGAKAGFFLAGGSAIPATAAIGGRISPGQAITATIAGSSISGSPVSVSYTAVAGDNAASVARGLAKAINSVQTLIAARVSAMASDGIVTVYWPADVSNSVSVAATESMTVMAGTGTARPGSDGLISAPIFSANPRAMPAFVIGNTVSAANAWSIIGPALTNGTAPLPANWLVMNSQQAGRVQEVVLSGIQWSTIRASNLSNCGTGPSFGPGRANDQSATVVEGNAATGCTVTFTTPYPWTPSVQITNWSGNAAPVTLSSVSPTGFTVSNPAAAGYKFTYQVTP